MFQFEPRVTRSKYTRIRIAYWNSRNINPNDVANLEANDEDISSALSMIKITKLIDKVVEKMDGCDYYIVFVAEVLGDINATTSLVNALDNLDDENKVAAEHLGSTPLGARKENIIYATNIPLGSFRVSTIPLKQDVSGLRCAVLFEILDAQDDTIVNIISFHSPGPNEGAYLNYANTGIRNFCSNSDCPSVAIGDFNVEPSLSSSRVTRQNVVRIDTGRYTTPHHNYDYAVGNSAAEDMIDGSMSSSAIGDDFSDHKAIFITLKIDRLHFHQPTLYFSDQNNASMEDKCLIM